MMILKVFSSLTDSLNLRDQRARFLQQDQSKPAKACSTFLVKVCLCTGWGLSAFPAVVGRVGICWCVLRSPLSPGHC